MKRFYLILFACLLSLTAYSQERDAVLWTGISVDKEVLKNVDWGLEQQLRFKQNWGTLSSYLTDVSLGYKLNKMFKLGLIYRYNVVNEGVNKHRLTGNLRFKERSKKLDLDFSYRMRYQREWELSENSTDDIWRNLLKIGYSKKKLDFSPYVAAELFYHIRYKGNRFDRYRLMAGCDYKIKKRQQVSLEYKFQQEINVASPSQDHILSLSYHYSLK